MTKEQRPSQAQQEKILQTPEFVLPHDIKRTYVMGRSSGQGGGGLLDPMDDGSYQVTYRLRHRYLDNFIRPTTRPGLVSGVEAIQEAPNLIKSYLISRYTYAGLPTADGLKLGGGQIYYELFKYFRETCETSRFGTDMEAVIKIGRRNAHLVSRGMIYPHGWTDNLTIEIAGRPIYAFSGQGALATRPT